MSTSGANACGDGLVDDNFLLYTTKPCSLRLNVHVGLSILWVILTALLFLELLVSRLLGYFSKSNASKKSTGSVLARDAAYVPFLVGILIMFCTVIADPQASVQNSVGSGLWFATFLSLSGMVGIPTATTIFSIAPLLSTMGITTNTFKHEDFNTTIFRIIKYFQYFICTSFFIIALVTFLILPNTLVNFRDRQMSIYVGFIGFGIAFALAITSITATCEAIIKVIDGRIQFERDLPANPHHHDVPTVLSVARARLRILVFLTPGFGLAFCVAYILIGANVIPLNWIVVHVFFGFWPILTSINYRAMMRDSILEAYCCLACARSASPHHSSKDRDGSDHGSGGRVAPMDQARLSSDYTIEMSTTPSKMLANLDPSSLKTTPAQALLTMQGKESA